MKYLVLPKRGSHDIFLSKMKQKIKQKILSSNIFSQVEFKVLKKNEPIKIVPKNTKGNRDKMKYRAINTLST